jgi:hypothetical protein
VSRPRLGGRSKVLVGALLLAAAPLLSACVGPNGQTLAAQACVHVHRSVADYNRSVLPGTAPARVVSLQQSAESELRDAEPLAAQANSADGTWNSLMTTISEIGYVDEGHLIPALDAICEEADANPNVNPDNPQSPSSGSGNSNSTTPTTSKPYSTANVNPASG